MIPTRLTKLGTLGAVAAAIIAAAGAPAQAQQTRHFSTVQSMDGENVSVTFNAKTDGRDLRLEFRNDKLVKGTIDGRDIPEERIRREGAKVEVLDDAGKVIFTGTIPDMIVTPPAPPRGGVGGRAGVAPPAPPGPPAPPAAAGGRGVARAPQAWVAQGEGGRGVWAARQPPKVMAGISLSNPDGALARHFDLKPTETTLLFAVYPGLPAAEAGIRPYDIVVEVNGKTPAGPDELRAALAAAEPGDAVKLTILQRGERKQVEMRVAAYDREKLDEAAAKFQAEQAARGDFFGQAFFPANPAAPQVDVQLLPGLEGVWVGQLDGPEAEKLRERMLILQRDATARVEEAQRRAEAAMREAETNRRLAEERFSALRPSVTAEPKQLERLEDRLERLERLLKELSEREAQRGGRRTD